MLSELTRPFDNNKMTPATLLRMPSVGLDGAEGGGAEAQEAVQGLPGDYIFSSYCHIILALFVLVKRVTR